MSDATPRSSEESDGALLFRFADHGDVPNHPRWPLVVYRGTIDCADAVDPAALLEKRFAQHGWGRSWRNGVYPYTHYHSAVHEMLGVARGVGAVQFGGEQGQILTLAAGDVAVLPAGTGHKRVSASPDFLVVGAYPPAGIYDECRPGEDHPGEHGAIAAAPRPATDPVHGPGGPLLTYWTPV